jgi:2-amino-4-hydroxy-6-hydroxymethyldihydropteridine diphosphokinase
VKIFNVNQLILHLGSNVGDREAHLTLALQKIEMKIGTIAMSSTIYETEAWGMADQADFLNMAVSVSTKTGLKDCFKLCKEIELMVSGPKDIKWGPRVLDIDLIFFNDEIYQDAQLTIPHPQIENRNFVLIPLMEICGNYTHPQYAKTIEELYDDCKDECQVYVYEKSK